MRKSNNIVILFITIYISLNYIWLFLDINDELLRGLGGALFSLCAPLISSVCLFVAFYKSKGYNKFFWFFVYSGVQSYFIGEIRWTYDQLIVTKPATFPSWADLFYMLTMVFHLMAVATIFYANRKNVNFIRFLYDVLIIMIVVTTFSWHFIIQPILSQQETFSLHVMVSVGYPVLGLILFFAMASLYFSSRDILPRKIIVLIFVACSIEILADSVFILTSSNTYFLGSLLDPLWSLALLLLGGAGIFALEDSKLEKRDYHTGKAKNKSMMFLAFRRLLPYAAVLLLFVAQIVTNKLNSLSTGFSISIVLIIVRQIFTLWENDSLVKKLHKLNEELEQKVLARTNEVTRKNEELEQMVASIQFLANHDVLCDLPNRRFFEATLNKVIQRSKMTNDSFALLFFDMDRFKLINDTYGHTFGDSLIQGLGDRLKNFANDKYFISRLGGDEFTILLESVGNRGEVTETVQTLQQILSKPYIIDGIEINLSISVGISLFPLNGKTSEELIKQADTAMYLAKETGRNNFKFYTSTLKDAYTAKLNMENRLRKAIDMNHFTLHYQPQLNIETGKVTCVEALLRWEDPHKRIISPGEFIPIAEETGLILPIGEWVLSTACKQMRYWNHAGYPDLRIAVNISPRQFQQKNFVEMIKKVLTDTGLNPQNLEIEITETLAMYNIEQVMQKLESLRRIGVHISIDDFGTGHSSLAYLKEFPIQTLKIAREFIVDFHAPANKAIITTIIMMAKNLNLNVIAEGVETEEQFSFLKAHECNEIQGYFYSKPLPHKDLENLLNEAYILS
ncbi:DUF4084 domain-containing protein [Bacillus sp. T33-2]|uniref:DUF4084 domain-containing protein n=1 Tax=Bacillus sp. T33-2 TaxID=2054168 RepID=UPI000C75EB60|nr:DUF4084 domain-containing protein [Bacillus sp. T33-2]PLR92544.1 diguanylate cyclase [Bacillus sp. T33-2]